MPMHKGFLPREGLCADVVLKLIRRTLLNPNLLLPLLLLARYTKKGQDLSILHPKAARRLRLLFYVAVARGLSGWLSDKVRNNWVSDKYDWSKEIVLITGGAAGIGASIVKLLDELKVRVVVLDVQRMTYTASSRVHHFYCDIRSPANVAAVAEKVVGQIGHPTVVINNAGVVRGKTILDATPEDVRFTFDVNALAPFWVTKAFLPHMVAQNHGMVVTVTSFASWVTVPNLVDYAASKAAAMSFHEGLSAELKTRYNAPKVRTVVVHPGASKTALFTGFNQGAPFLLPSQEPDSIAEAVVKQILSGRSGQVIMPEAGGMLPALRVYPDWHSFRVRSRGQRSMLNYNGRQVIEDPAAPFEANDSTVLVPTA
ncbi:short chain dehydrogenase/reductase [Trichoderma guizhouense]|uniref:Short-chain dehydrogenase/reductase 3 n=1 Tax=Trichoderma guizhouense TaxID=1491466 RepID=A0A1T3CM39_9HYPO|nr:short chain dehydrogenase/reductase [Trichoderma guizhouense]